MANPQCEDGHLRLANELIDELLKQNLTGREFRVFMAIARKTYGFNKKKDIIAMSQIMKITGIQRQHCSEIVRKLVCRNMVTVTNRGTGRANTLSINKDYSLWKSVTDVGYCNRRGFRGCPDVGDRSVTTVGTHNRQKTLSKDKGWSPYGSSYPDLKQMPHTCPKCKRQFMSEYADPNLPCGNCLAKIAERQLYGEAT